VGAACRSISKLLEIVMKKIIIATTALALMCGSAFAQGATGPAAQQDNMTKPGMTGSTEKGAMNKGSMNNGTTTGMNNGMAKGGMKPDASGQGGSGPGSDQGGTKVSPNNMK
jgi:pentapeptide MXKDX repeat protein